MKRYVLTGAAIIAIGAFFLGTNIYQGELELPQSNTEERSNLNNELVSLEQLGLHDNTDDCWIVYKNKVYDVTMFLPIHPGGPERIAQFCGNPSTDFENAFHGQHGTSKVKKLESDAGKLQGEFK